MGKPKSWRGCLINLTSIWVMCTDFIQRGEVLGLIALSCNQVMSTYRIEGVITGNLESG